MKKILQGVCAATCIFLAAGSVLARGGGFYADKQTGIYHVSTHIDAQPADEANKAVFNTPKEAEAAGYKPCAMCGPSERLSTVEEPNEKK